jgi:hypothetical protein
MRLRFDINRRTYGELTLGTHPTDDEVARFTLTLFDSQGVELPETSSYDEAREDLLPFLDDVTNDLLWFVAARLRHFQQNTYLL